MIKILFNHLPDKFTYEIRHGFRKFHTDENLEISGAERYEIFVNNYLSRYPYYIKFINSNSQYFEDDKFEFTDESYLLFLLQYS